MRIKMKKPRIYIAGHLLENVSYQRSYLTKKGHQGWVSIVDDSGKTIHLSKTMQELFEIQQESAQ